MGIMLYWTEGAKSKSYNISQGVIFSSSDPLMIKVFLLWLKDSIKINPKMIIFEIYIHENNKSNIDHFKNFRASVTGFPVSKFGKIYYKRNIVNTKRKNTKSLYYGLLRIRIARSTNLNRQITGWISAICSRCGVV